jgi:hypothetical protein
MTQRDIYNAVFAAKPPASDRRPLWKRFLASLKLDLKLQPKLKQPIKHLIIKGSLEF